MKDKNNNIPGKQKIDAAEQLIKARAIIEARLSSWRQLCSEKVIAPIMLIGMNDQGVLQILNHANMSPLHMAKVIVSAQSLLLEKADPANQQLIINPNDNGA